MRDKKVGKIRKSTQGWPRQSSKPKSDDELKLLKSIGEKIYKDLYRLEKPVEWLAFESETSRATVRRVFDADRNVGLVTIDRITKALGYKDLVDFFKRF